MILEIPSMSGQKNDSESKKRRMRGTGLTYVDFSNYPEGRGKKEETIYGGTSARG